MYIMYVRTYVCLYACIHIHIDEKIDKVHHDYSIIMENKKFKLFDTTDVFPFSKVRIPLFYFICHQIFTMHL